MKILLDTQVLIWTALNPKRLREKSVKLLEDEAVSKAFSVVSLWEIGVKRAAGRSDFEVDPHTIRSYFRSRGVLELEVTASHVLHVSQLPARHGDPFDRLLLCQAAVEGMTLVTADRQLLEYPQATHRAWPATLATVIAHIRGSIVSKGPSGVVVECAGVGYELAISVATFTDLPAENAEARLHVHTHVREDALQLFGFSQLNEKRLFEKLLTISGIGPKLAITVLSGIAAERLVGAIRAGDHATLTRISGIGKKTAERVVLELKDKLDDLAGLHVATDAPVSLGAVADDVLSALVNLGYPRPAAQKAVEGAAKDAAVAGDFETLFRAAMGAVR